MSQTVVQDQISQEVTINASVERVWSLLTEGLGEWFPDNGADIDLRVGGDVALRWRDYGTFHGIVEQLAPMSTFALRWAMNAGEAITPSNSTRVEFSLTPDGDGVRLRVVESGFSQLAISPEAQAKHAEENIGGWASELDKLRTMVESQSA